MGEVEVARFKHAHHLQAYGGLTVEGYGGLLQELHDEPLNGDGVYMQVAAVAETLQTVQEGVCTETGLGVERVV